MKAENRNIEDRMKKNFVSLRLRENNKYNYLSYDKIRRHIMKKIAIVGIILFISATAFAEKGGFEGRSITDNIWMPTGHTLNRGEFDIGLGAIGIGLNDNVQIGTNILLFLFQVYNANLKITMVNTDFTAISAGLEYSRFNLSALIGGEEMAFNTISPYLAISTKIGENTTFHIAGKYSYFTVDEEVDEYKPQSSSSGTQVMGGLEYSISYRTKLLGEVGYDVTFEGMRVGGAVLFGWETFRLKLGVSYYQPRYAPEGFSLPIIGLWWRFDG